MISLLDVPWTDLLPMPYVPIVAAISLAGGFWYGVTHSGGQ